ncbi:DeoR/GlpR transcriptional regulator [Nordella sp. HKS 07]|uniref:DeoR/GlpR family DNA-binding transcription regulator n=1 Tax=Nordella sp. HKS 07 TaxID=2712222 RepID=UPI0013E1BC05|nr:DeoR/GlpR family DNA-binding transcription regulator [Nordella sp. HKS 07]QIG48511.1 DeoR/GlpR transcriptional regulator [Nordella sp. HKS 07]
MVSPSETPDSNVTDSRPETGRRLPVELRQAHIIEQLRKTGFVSVAEVAAALAVSEMTIRRDLIDLETDGRLVRTHGGAIAPEGTAALAFEREEPAFEQRLRQNNAAKEAIATVAASLLGTRQSVALDVGSSAFVLAARLRALTGIKIFTNSLRVASLLGRERRDVYLPGGEVRGDEMSICGPTAVAQFEQLWFDIAFIGAAGLTQAGLFDYSLEDSELKRVYLRRSSRKVLLCDAAKFNRLSLVQVAALDSIDMLITDATPSGELADALASANVEVRLANPATITS